LVIGYHDAVLHGTIAAAVIYGWSVTLGILLVGVLVVNLTHRSGGIVFYHAGFAAGLVGISAVGECTIPANATSSRSGRGSHLLGEELGWRGFLLPRLLPIGQTRAIGLSGAIWGIWHAPAILQGHNYPSQPVLGIFLMIVFCVLLGTILSWLYLQTRSPWAPALGHGTINATAGLSLLFVPDVDLVIGGTTASIIGWIPLAAIVAWLVLTRRLPVTSAEAGAATSGSEPPRASADHHR
jgi:hypothetical protein